MTRNEKIATGFLAAFATVFTIKVVSDALTPEPAWPYSKGAELEDWKFYRRLLALAANPSKPARLRVKARVGAVAFKEKWLDKGHAGCSLKTQKKRKIYGEWCGANHGGGTPINEIDEACRAHDRGRAAAFAGCGVHENCVFA